MNNSREIACTPPLFAVGMSASLEVLNKVPGNRQRSHHLPISMDVIAPKTHLH
jgi:hypothetical protein